MKNLKNLIEECSGSIFTNQDMGKIVGGIRNFTSVISNENTDMNGDGKSDDCLYDADPLQTDTLPPVVATIL